ncbi:kinase-like protein [Artomyces pyxidatus]|uniref:Kinase-like protein n=1 Tax=Artomyces pyxidatus TaxID=48021 RepID=A0ACB8SQ69_9AGAM|nr:kinase-like protein [Artomyces pyxidatus]
MESDGHLAQAFQPGYPYDMEQTQETQVSTQQASQQYDNHPMNSHLFGYLQPCTINMARVDLYKAVPEVKIGRAPAPVNDLVFPSMKISQRHCRLSWNGAEDHTSIVTITDTSTNGTWINGTRVEKNNYAILRDGNEIAFGSPSPNSKREEDFRFIYRHLAGPTHVDPVHEKYELASELGKGSFATVMRAVEKQTGEWWAVKIIHGSKVRGNDAQQKITAFAREISILESLHHPNICRLRETFMPAADSQSDIFLVLELVDGGDLLDFILTRGGLDEPMAIHITRQICCAMAYIHGKGIAHRDLKPENVLMTKDDPPIAKVADFGLAKAVDSFTMLKTMCGTPSYLAPEVVNQSSNEGYDHLVDSWSVGVIVFSMFVQPALVPDYYALRRAALRLTGSSPFIEDETVTDLKRRIAERTIDWSVLDSSGVSNACHHFVQRLLDYDPTTRMSLSDAQYHAWLAPPKQQETQTFVIPQGLSQTTDDSIEYPDLDSNGADASMASIDGAGLAMDSLNIQSSPAAGPKGKQREPASNVPGAFARVRVPLERRSQVLAREAEEEARSKATSASASPETPISGDAESSSSGKRGRSSPKDELMGAIEEDAMEEEQPLSKRNRRADEDAIPESAIPAPRKKNNVRNAAGPKRGVRTTALREEQDDESVRRSPRTAPAKPARR